MKEYKKYYIIEGSPQEVYNALTNKQSLELWTGEAAEMSTEPGSEFSMWEGSIIGKNIDFVEGKKIVQQWYFGEQKEESIVTIILHEDREGTSAELRHTNIPDSYFQNIVDGWEHTYFGGLQDFLESNLVMKAASLNELKKELKNLEPEQVLEFCLRLGRFKKENKELLTYLLFEAHDEQAYIENIKTQIDEQFTEINRSNLYYAKKGLRKILRSTSKFIRYSGSKQTEVELLIYFCTKLKKSSIAIHSSAALLNLYQMQIKKSTKALSGLHEDLQYDYKEELDKLS